MIFIGIDLAWSERNGSGIAVLKGNKKEAKFFSADIFLSDNEILNHVKEQAKDEQVFIAIDAPLIVPNEQGRRVAEKLVGMLFRKYNAGAHPANRKRLSQWGGKIRGEEISKRLEAIGITHSPYIKKYENKKKFFEVYPHPSMVVLFNLNKILQYKSKPNRDHAFLVSMFKKYQDYLGNLKAGNPKLKIPEEVLKVDTEKLKGKHLKSYEDKLDAIFCAYIAYYSWCCPDKCAVLGSMEEGYILTPVFEGMKQQLKEISSQLSLEEFNKT